MGEWTGIVKRVSFSCRVKIIPQVFQATPPAKLHILDPYLGSGSSKPSRIRKPPDRYGISRDP
jgi:hypothetical protein